MLRRLRERVVFQRRQRVGDGAGGYAGGWVDLCSRPAEVAPHTAGGSGKEEVIAQRLQGVMLFDLWVRGDPQTLALTVDDRAIQASTPHSPGRVFDIRAITNPDMKRAWLVLTCEQGDAPG